MTLSLKFKSILFGFFCLFIVNELSKVKRDLEVALKDVLQAMSANEGTSNNPNLEKLGDVGADVENCFSVQDFNF